MPAKFPSFTLVCALLLSFFTVSAQSNYTTTNFTVPKGDVTLQVRKVTEETYSSKRKIPILFVNGGTGAMTSFDLDVPDASFAKALADAGFAVYMMNIRGWEQSTAPAYSLTDTSLVAASGQEAISDICAVVEYLVKDIPTGKINLFGWAAGGHWASYYTTLHNDKVANLIVLNSLYGVKAPWQFNEVFADPANPQKFNNAIPVYRQSTEQAVINIWQTAITPADTLVKADSVVIKAFAKSAVSYNPEHLLKTPGGFRKESFYMAQGKKYWDARDIAVPTLLIRSDHDFWSRPIDLETYFAELVNVPNKKKVVLVNANHFPFLDTSNVRRKLIISINNFVKKGL